jgi:flagellar protein FlaF
MYQFSYAEVIEDDPGHARRTERMALDHAIELLRLAKEKGPRSREAIDALHFVRSLWTIFIDDLAGSGNDLPEPARAGLISIGLWIVKEAEQIRLDRSHNFSGISDICAMIRDGLV